MRTTTTIAFSTLLFAAACTSGKTPVNRTDLRMQDLGGADLTGGGGTVDLAGADLSSSGSPDMAVNVNADMTGSTVGDMSGTTVTTDLAGADFAQNSNCTAPSTFGALGTKVGQATSDFDQSTGAEVIGWLAPANTDTQPDYVALQLYEGFGAFTTGTIRTGTFQLSGDELNYASCGICVLVYSNVHVDMTTMMTVYTDAYFATGGEVTLTSVSGRLTGSIKNASFTHVVIDPNTFQSTPVGDGCNSYWSLLSFDDVIM